MIRVLAFDLDGTLLDARARQVHVLAKACLAQNDRAPDEVRFWKLKRTGLTTIGALEEMGYGQQRARAINAYWIEHVEGSDVLCHDRVLAHAVQALHLARAHDLMPRILTARSNAVLVASQLDNCGLAALADGVRVVRPANAATEKAAVLREWQAIAMIGDTESDARAAALASIPFLAVLTGQRSAAFLAARSISAFDDVLSAVEHLVAEEHASRFRPKTVS